MYRGASGWSGAVDRGSARGPGGWTFLTSDPPPSPPREPSSATRHQGGRAEEGIRLARTGSICTASSSAAIRIPHEAEDGLRGSLPMPFTLGFDVFVIVLVLLVIITIAMGVRTIPQGYAYTVERFGRYARTLGPGVGLIVPYIERIGHKVNVMEQVLDVPSQEAFTRDNAGVTIDAAAFYQVMEPARSSYEVADLQQADRKST